MGANTMETTALEYLKYLHVNYAALGPEIIEILGFRRREGLN